ncbi:hypothetical protein [Hirschia litorea]|uniref:Tetratricopeptide repeat protein n=1 Tax=Hirschia litorea TaxID=1199156 RepID=A0ABW2IM13_9PROT
MLKLLTKCAGGLIGVLALSNCASPGLDYTVAEPAYNTEAAKLRDVAVMGFGGPHGHAFTSSLDGMLRAATFEGYPWFQVSPYHSQSGGWGGSLGEARRMGNDLGVSGVWYGEVDSRSSISPPFRETRSRCVEWNDDKKCVVRANYHVECFDIRAEVRVHALLADVREGYIAADERMSDQDSDRVCRETVHYQSSKKRGKGDRRNRNPYPSHYGSGFGGGYGHDFWEAQERGRRMERRLVVQQASRLRRVIAPYERTSRAYLMEVPSLPYMDLVNGFDTALSAAKNGNNLMSCRQFDDLSVQFPDDAFLKFNLGACAEMFGELDDAMRLYEQANDLAGPMPDEDFTKLYQKAFKRVSDLQLNQVYLERQLEEVNAQEGWPEDDAFEDDTLAGGAPSS